MEIGPIWRAMKRRKARFILIAAEVALTLAIVTNAVGLILDAQQEMNRPSGFDDEHLITVDINNYGQAFGDEEYVRTVVDADTEALRNLPGVLAASHTHFVPWRGGGSSGELQILGGGPKKYRTQTYSADPGIFDTLGVEILEGRAFDEEDFAADPEGDQFNVVVSRDLATLVFPEGDALGQSFYFSDPATSFVIVGIFGEFFNPYGWPIGEYAVFFPARSAGAEGHRFLVRAEPGQLDEVFGSIEGILTSIDGERALTLRTITEIKTGYHSGRQVMVKNLNLLMVVLLVVTALGIIGLTSFSVTERRRQIGTRRALGATKADVVRYFLIENWMVTTLGVVVGILLAVVLNNLLLTVVAGATLAWEILVGGVVLLWLLGLGATLGPALRAAGVPPALATQNV